MTTTTTEVELTCEEKLEALEEHCRELEEALRKEIQFKTAKELGGKQIWLPMTNLVDIFHKSWKLFNSIKGERSAMKLVFSISNEGRIIGVESHSEENK